MHQDNAQDKIPLVVESPDWTQVDWEAEYAAGRARARYPYDQVVSFVFRHGKPGNRILEVGCGDGANIWFCAREGFDTAGIDISETAIRTARERLAQEGLAADLRIGDFHELPWGDDSFDLVFERGAFVCSSDHKAALAEAVRVLKPGGRFLSVPIR